MATIDDIRKANPGIYGKLTEYEIVDRLAAITKQDPSIVAYDLGVQRRNEPGFGTAFKGMIGSQVQSIGQLGADFLPGVETDNPVERYGREVGQRNPNTVMEGSGNALENITSNLVNDPLGTTGQIMGGVAGLMTPGTVLKAANWGIRGLRGAQAAAELNTAQKLAYGAAGAAGYGLPSYGSMRDEQEAQGMNSSTDIAKAGLSALGIGAIERFAGPEAILARGFKGVAAPAKSFTGNVVRQGLGEAGEELMQAPLEAYGSGKDPFTKDVLIQGAAGAVAGFVGGGLTGGVTYPFIPKDRSATRELMESSEQVNLTGTPDNAISPALRRINAGRNLPQFGLDVPESATVTPQGDVLTSQEQIDAYNQFGAAQPIPRTIPLEQARTRKTVQNFLDQQLNEGLISEEQHIEASNLVDTYSGNITKLKDKITPIISAPVDTTAVQQPDATVQQETPALELPAVSYESVSDKPSLLNFFTSRLQEGAISQAQYDTAVAKIEKSKKGIAQIKKELAPVAALTQLGRNATPEQVAAFRTQMRDMLRQSLTDAQYDALVLTRGVRNEDDSDWAVDPESGAVLAPMSNTVAAAETGRDPKKISRSATAALKKLRTRAQDLGMDARAAEIIMGFQGEPIAMPTSISAAQAAQAGLTVKGGTTQQAAQADDVNADEENMAAETDAETEAATNAEEEQDVDSTDEEDFAEAADELTTADVLLARDVWDMLAEDIDGDVEILSWNQLTEDQISEFSEAVRRNRLIARGEESIRELKTTQTEISDDNRTRTTQETNARAEGRATGADGKTKQTTTADREETDSQAISTGVKEVEALVTDADVALITNDAQLGNGNYEAGRTALMSYVARAINGEALAFLKKSVRQLVERVKNGVMAFAVAVNLNVAPAPNTVIIPVETETVTQTVSAYSKQVNNGATEVTPTVASIANHALNTGNGSAFMVIDKPNATLYAYDKEGNLVGTTAALTGKAFGDVATDANKAIEDYTDTDKITPAGKFTGNFSFNEDYGSVVALAETVNEQTFVAVHRTYLGNPSEKRAERLATPTVADNRVSYGCINVPSEFYDSVVAEYFVNPSQIYVMPDQSDAKKFFNVQETKTVTSQVTRTKSTADKVAAQKLDADRRKTVASKTPTATDEQIKKLSVFKMKDFALKTVPRFATPKTWVVFLNALKNDYSSATLKQLRTAIAQDAKLAGIEFDIALNMLESHFDSIDYSMQAPNRKAATITQQLKAMFVSSEGFDNLVTVFQNKKDMLAMFPELDSQDSFTQGFVYKGKVYLVVDNIEPGKEFSILMHELGVHMGVNNLLTAQQMKQLIDQVKDWASQSGNSVEVKLAKEALAKMEDARETYKEQQKVDATQRTTKTEGGVSISLLDEELLAYFVDAAVASGISPQAVALRQNAVGKWFKQLLGILNNALKKLGFQSKAPLTGQDYVDIAYGLAQLQLDGAPVNFVQDEPRFASSKKSTPPAGATANFTERMIESLPPPVADKVQYLADMLVDAGKTLSIFSMFTKDLVDIAKKNIPSVERWYNLVNARAVDQVKREAEIDDIANDSDKLTREQFERTWQAILDMTGNQKWGYQPTWRDEVKVDSEMAARYNALSNEEKALIDRVFKHGHDTLIETQKVLDQIVDSEFRQKIANAKTPAEKATLIRQERKFKEMFGRKLSALEGPYAPMRRVGSHVVVARSNELIEAIDRKDSKRIDELRIDENYYVVKFYDSMAEAKQERRRLIREGKFPESNIRAAKKDVVSDSIQTLPFEAFDQIRQMASEKEGDIAKKLTNLVTELYLTSLAETSARKSELRRENIKGLNADTMYKAFISKGRASAHYIAVLKNNKQIGDAFAQMRQEAKANTDMSIFNELAKRYANSVKYENMPVTNALLGTSAVWNLLTKPAYYVYNATQPAMMTLPYMTQKFEYGRSAAALTKAYKDLSKAKNFFSLTDASIHIESMPADVQRALRDLLDSGKLDITITQDLGARLNTGQGDVSRAGAAAVRTLRTAAQKVETANRVVTAISAYRLAMTERGATHESAVQYAADVIDATQGDYSNFNAPRLFNQTAFQRLISQFRKFQLIQITFIVKLVKGSIAGKSPEERAATRKALAFTLAHTGLLAGALGLPAANIIAAVFSAAGGDDEPRDLEIEMRKALGNGFMADLVTRGAPAAVLNVNMSNSIGMGQAFSLLPYTDVEFTREGYNAALAGSMGPLLGGTVPQVWNAMGSFGKGDYYKGLEGMMPSGARSALRAAREAVGGVTNTRGDELVSADELTLLHSVASALGFKLQDDAVRQLIRGKTYEFEKHYKELTTQLKNRYANAYTNGDVDEMMEIREEWREMNAAKRAYGFTVQPISNLLKAPRERRERETDTVGGVQVRKSNKRFVESLVDDEE